MTNYKERFDSNLAEATSAVANLITDFDLVVPGLRPTGIKRLFNTISRLLGRLDKDGSQYPEFLVDGDGSIPEQAIRELAKVKASTASGAESFLTTTIFNFAYYQNHLEQALAFRPKDIRDIKSQQIREIQSILGDSQQSLAQLQSIRRSVEGERVRTEKAITSIDEASKAASDAVSYISKTRQSVERLASGDARGRDSLEKLVRVTRGKMVEIEASEQAAKKAEAACLTINHSMAATLTSADTALENMLRTQKQADDILKGATQAGLAGAYKTERDRLAREQLWYAGVFYGGVAIILLYAIFFLLPIFSAIIERTADAQVKMGESALLLLVRLFVLAPVIWALMFTNRRYIKLETLQMDYAAKAATALAYSGYKDEMADDVELSTKLKDGLLVRFLEHPERLLNKEIRESVGMTTDGGLTYNSTSEPISRSD